MGMRTNTESKVEVLPVQDAHIPEIIKIWKEFMDFHKGIDLFFARSADGHIHQEKHIRDSMQSENAQVLVAVRNGEVVAYSISEIHVRPPVFCYRTFGVISDLAVKSAYRGKGIGGKMLEKIFEWFNSRNIHRIELRVVSENQIGYNFWKKHGFQDYMHSLYQIRK